MAVGEYQALLDDALAGDLERVLSARSSDDLARLSHAARYLGRTDVAKTPC